MSYCYRRPTAMRLWQILSVSRDVFASRGLSKWLRMHWRCNNTQRNQSGHRSFMPGFAPFSSDTCFKYSVCIYLLCAFHSISQPGNYCPAGSMSQKLCPIGTFSPSYGNADISSCLPGLGGFFYNSTGLTTFSGNCFPGSLYYFHL